MASTISNISLAKNTWTDLYTGSGLTVGTAINVQNIGPGNVLLYSGASSPTTLDGYRILKPYEQAENESTDDGAFCCSVNGTGLVNVKVA